MATTLHLYDYVELVAPIADERVWWPHVYGTPHLAPGDRGGVMILHPDGTATVEFMRGNRTVAVVDIHPDEVCLATTSHPLPASTERTRTEQEQLDDARANAHVVRRAWDADAYRLNKFSLELETWENISTSAEFDGVTDSLDAVEGALSRLQATYAALLVVADRLRLALSTSNNS